MSNSNNQPTGLFQPILGPPPPPKTQEELLNTPILHIADIYRTRNAFREHLEGPKCNIEFVCNQQTGEFLYNIDQTMTDKHTVFYVTIKLGKFAKGVPHDAYANSVIETLCSLPIRLLVFKSADVNMRIVSIIVYGLIARNLEKLYYIQASLGNVAFSLRCLNENKNLRTLILFECYIGDIQTLPPTDMIPVPHTGITNHSLRQFIVYSTRDLNFPVLCFWAGCESALEEFSVGAHEYRHVVSREMITNLRRNTALRRIEFTSSYNDNPRVEMQFMNRAVTQGWPRLTYAKFKKIGDVSPLTADEVVIQRQLAINNYRYPKRTFFNMTADELLQAIHTDYPERAVFVDNINIVNCDVGIVGTMAIYARLVGKYKSCRVIDFIGCEVR